MACNENSCGITGGWALTNCAFGAGGLNKIYISTGITSYSLNSDCQVTATTGTFYTFDLVNESATANEASKGSLENQSFYVEGNVEFIIPSKTNYAAIRNQVQALSKMSGAHIITKDNNGIYKLWGATNKCFLVEGGANTGKALGDSQSFTLKFLTKEPNFAYEVASSAAFTTSY